MRLKWRISKAFKISDMMMSQLVALTRISILKLSPLPNKNNLLA